MAKDSYVAFRTEPVQFKNLGGQTKTVRGGDPMAQMFNGGILELDDIPAICANQVIMVAL
jgi:hypothetical protein